MNGTLSIVATPIGNLKDITERALDTLRSADVILCEDTRVTRNLLARYEIDTDVMSYHQHSDNKVVDSISSLLEQGKHLALVTDAGTPGISDPGNLLVHHLTNTLINKLTITPIPGPSAVIAALSISGFPTDKFIFLGFPPLKKKRKKYFEELVAQKHTVVFYESCHRIKKALTNLAEVLDEDAQICVCRELTKKFESVYRGTIEEVMAMEMPEKGEFVVVVRR